MSRIKKLSDEKIAEQNAARKELKKFADDNHLSCQKIKLHLDLDMDTSSLYRFLEKGTYI